VPSDRSAFAGVGMMLVLHNVAIGGNALISIHKIAVNPYSTDNLETA
jgi:hypothetical protein